MRFVGPGSMVVQTVPQNFSGGLSRRTKIRTREKLTRSVLLVLNLKKVLNLNFSNLV